MTRALMLGLVALLGAATAPAQAFDRFALQGGCYTLKAGDATVAGPIRMQATQLGRYLLYTRDGRFLSADAGSAAVAPASEPSPLGDWFVDEQGRVTLAGRAGGLGAGPALVEPAPRISFEPAGGCPSYPEITLNVTGEASTGDTPYETVRGFLDAHMHWMAFEFIGGGFHCGRPWHRYGVQYALVDCPDHEPNGATAAGEQAVSGYVGPHDTVGWPTFKDWPAPRSFTHEQTYYRWIERMHRAGLRLFVNLYVENGVLCSLYPVKKNSCDDMDSIRLQAKRMREMIDYIDAQAGGPGKGFLQLAKDPFQARALMNSGKLALVEGIETSKLFGCGITENLAPTCSLPQMEAQLEEVHRMGVRQMEIINKFDNGFGGVAGDEGETGTVVNQGNKLDTGAYWRMQTCPDPRAAETHKHDREQTTVASAGPEQDAIFGLALGRLLPAGIAPVYPKAPHCNTLGLTQLGERLVRRMIDKGMIIDPDHLSVAARDEVLALVEAERHSGIVSSHSWSTPEDYPRIYRLGGVVTPIAGSSTKRFIETYEQTKPRRDKRYLFGFGYGADQNGLATQPLPGGGKIAYPFKSFDGRQTFAQQRSGERVYDIDVDGVAHYGLFPDWIEQLRTVGGPAIVEDMARGAEAYLQMWERALGVPANRCLAARDKLQPSGAEKIRLREDVELTLRRAGQPDRREGRMFEYCVTARHRRPPGRLAAVFTAGGRVAMVATSGREHRAAGPRAGDRAVKVRGARRLGPGLLVKRAGRGARYLYAIKRGRVAHVAVATPSVARSYKTARRALRRAGF